MMTKYDFSFSNEVIYNDIMRLTNQLWKLIPMYENAEDWRKQLLTVLVEIRGLNEIFINNPLFLQVLSKLEGLSKTIDADMDFVIYRKIVFESINILQRLIKNA